MTYFVLAVLVMAALVFGASAGGKLRSPAAYRRYRAAMAGAGLRPVLAAGLAVSELGVSLVLGTAVVMVVAAAPGAELVVQSALGLAVLLTCALVAGVQVLIRRGVRARCACFGSSPGQPIGVAHLVRNVTLLVLVLAGLVAGGAGAGPVAAGGVVMAGVAGGCLALLIVRWEDLAVLVTPVAR